MVRIPLTQLTVHDAIDEGEVQAKELDDGLLRPEDERSADRDEEEMAVATLKFSNHAP